MTAMGSTEELLLPPEYLFASEWERESAPSLPPLRGRGGASRHKRRRQQQQQPPHSSLPLAGDEDKPQQQVSVKELS